MLRLENVGASKKGRGGGLYGSSCSKNSQRVHVAIWYILSPSSRYMGTPLGPKYIPYSYMDPLGFGSVGDPC